MNIQVKTRTEALILLVRGEKLISSSNTSIHMAHSNRGSPEFIYTDWAGRESPIQATLNAREDGSLQYGWYLKTDVTLKTGSISIEIPVNELAEFKRAVAAL